MKAVGGFKNKSNTNKKNIYSGYGASKTGLPDENNYTF